MLVKLAYGRTGLAVEFPDDITTVIEPTFLPGLPDQENAVLNANYLLQQIQPLLPVPHGDRCMHEFVR